MIYKQFQDRKLSALGFGCMRLPTIGGDDAKPNEEETAKLGAKAMEAGSTTTTPPGATTPAIRRPSWAGF